MAPLHALGGKFRDMLAAAKAHSAPEMGARTSTLLLQAVHTFATLDPRSVEVIDFVLYDAAALSTWRAILRST